MSAKSPVLLDNRWTIPTPENVTFEHTLAGPFLRGLSYLIDLFMLVVWWTLLLLVYWTMSVAMGSTGFAADELVGFYMMVGLISSFFFFWFYGAGMEAWNQGQTVGKMCCGLRVVNLEGAPINAWQAILRNFFRLVDTAPTVSLGLFWGVGSEGGEGAALSIPTGLVGLITMSLDPQYRRVGDWVAGTAVVRKTNVALWQKDTTERRAAKNKESNDGSEPAAAEHLPVGAVRFADPRVAGLAELLPAQGLVDRQMAEALAVYVARRELFADARREEIARPLASCLLFELGLPANTNHDLLLCALYHRSQASERIRAEELERWQSYRQSMGPGARAATREGVRP